MNDDDRLAKLERQMEATLRRLDALEGEPSPPDPGEPSREAPDEEGWAQGTVAIAGSIRLGQRRLRMRVQEDVAEALDAEPASVARVFAALSNPFRLLLLRAVLERTRTSQELQAALNVGPAGQLYHHLKELLVAGLIVQRKRGVYAVREEKTMLICLMLVVARRLIPDHAVAPEVAEHASQESLSDEEDLL